MIGSITFGGGSLTHTIGGNSVTFTVDTLDYQHFQLCSNGTAVTLYSDCEVIGSESFTAGSLGDNYFIYILATPTGADLFSVQFTMIVKLHVAISVFLFPG